MFLHTLRLNRLRIVFRGSVSPIRLGVYGRVLTAFLMLKNMQGQVLIGQDCEHLPFRFFSIADIAGALGESPDPDNDCRKALAKPPAG